MSLESHLSESQGQRIVDQLPPYSSVITVLISIPTTQTPNTFCSLQLTLSIISVITMYIIAVIFSVMVAVSSAVPSKTTSQPIPHTGDLQLPYRISHSFSPEIPVDGFVFMNMTSTGDVQWFTVFNHKSGNDVPAYGVACAIQDSHSRVYTMVRRGFLGPAGTLLAVDIVDSKKHFAEVEANWKDIVQGDRKVVCWWEVANMVDSRALRDLAVGSMMKPASVVRPLF